MHETIVHELREAFARDPDLPTLPDHVHRILALLADEEAPLAAVAQEMERDPAIALRIMRLANSPIYGQAREVNSVQRALSVIGLGQVPGLLAGIASMDACERFLGSSGFEWEAFWEHCSGTAFVASTLGRRLRMSFGGREFLGGLLHDVGYLALAKFRPEAFQASVQCAIHRHGFLPTELQARFGVGTEVAGEVLAEGSGLAPEVVSVIRHLHDPAQASGEAQVLVSLVSLANELAHAMGLTFFRGTADVELVVTELPAWKLLARERPEIEEWDFARLMLDLEREYGASQHFVREIRTAGG